MNYIQNDRFKQKLKAYKLLKLNRSDFVVLRKNIIVDFNRDLAIIRVGSKPWFN